MQNAEWGTGAARACGHLGRRIRFCIHHSSFSISPDPMPLPATLLILATLLPLASFGVLVFVGRRMGTPLAGWFATAAIGGSFICSVLAMGYWYHGGQMVTPGAAPERVTWGYNVRPI